MRISRRISHIILIEGKRTESSPTTHTSWMPVRHQMLRNIDAAWDSGKTVVGFFIIEGRNPSPLDVPLDWQAAARATVSSDTLVESLPHREDDAREAIAAAFRGITTWQRVCQELSVPWTNLPHSLEEQPTWE
jgi:hypothetical protein